MAAVISLTADQVRWYRLTAHHLDRQYPLCRLEEVAGVCGLQNSPPGAWETALFARVKGCTAAQLRSALEEEKTLLQAWSYRGAPVVFPEKESAVFLQALTARAGEEPWIYTRGITLALDYLGIDWNQALDLVRRAVRCLDGRTIRSKEELDRMLAAEVAAELPPALRKRWNDPTMYGPPERQTVGGAVVSFALRPCAFLGLVVFGARQGISPTFTSYTHWVGHPMRPDAQAEAKLVRKFLKAYGPATASDLGNWLGCSPAQAKRLWQTVAEELVPVDKAGKRGYVLQKELSALTGAVPPVQPLRLLGAHDPYLDARDRWLLLADTTLQRKVWKMVANPNVVLRQGKVAGIWQTRTVRDTVEATFTLFEDFSAAETALLTQMAEQYAAFRQIRLRRCAVQSI